MKKSKLDIKIGAGPLIFATVFAWILQGPLHAEPSTPAWILLIIDSWVAFIGTIFWLSLIILAAVIVIYICIPKDT